MSALELIAELAGSAAVGAAASTYATKKKQQPLPLPDRQCGSPAASLAKPSSGPFEVGTVVRCPGSADPRCEGKNCTKHCREHCGGECLK